LITVREGADLQISDHNVLPYKVIRNLGMGGCASVEMVEDTTTGQLFAHKIFRRYHGPNLKKFRLEVRNEIKIMRRLSSHPHIIRLFATYACKRDFGMILTPVADGGDLATYLLNILDSGNPPTAENRAVLMRAFGCLANGLAFIHKQTIRHKDIKPQNILIHQGRIIYTDFGIAFDATQHDSTTTTGRPNAFTRRYCAPEVASWAKRNRKSDIFSLGCVFIEVLTVLEPLLHSEHL
ncbi:kinase-like protein, partial [Periconia macrospinosa]